MKLVLWNNEEVELNDREARELLEEDGTVTKIFPFRTIEELALTHGCQITEVAPNAFSMYQSSKNYMVSFLVKGSRMEDGYEAYETSCVTPENANSEVTKLHPDRVALQRAKSGCYLQLLGIKGQIYSSSEISFKECEISTVKNATVEPIKSYREADAQLPSLDNMKMEQEKRERKEEKEEVSSMGEDIFATDEEPEDIFATEAETDVVTENEAEVKSKGKEKDLTKEEQKEPEKEETKPAAKKASEKKVEEKAEKKETPKKAEAKSQPTEDYIQLEENADIDAIPDEDLGRILFDAGTEFKERPIPMQEFKDNYASFYQYILASKVKDKRVQQFRKIATRMEAMAS